jgi:hypothetical protein
MLMWKRNILKCRREASFQIWNDGKNEWRTEKTGKVNILVEW